MSGSSIGASLEAILYDEDNVFVTELDTALARSYQDRAGEHGAGTLTMRHDDPKAAQVGTHSIIKYRLFGSERFGVRVAGPEQASYTEDLVKVTWSCLGLLSLLGDAVILPEGGTIRANSTDTRWLGWMSAAFDAAGFTAVIDGIAWTDSDNLSARRLGNPVDWVDPTAMWITVHGSEAQLYKADCIVPADAVLRLWASVDESITVWWDGEKISDEDWVHDEVGYTVMHEAKLGIVAAGTHHVAVEMRLKGTPIIGDGLDAFILCVGTIGADNNLDTVLLHSSDDPDVWIAYGSDWDDPRPGLTLGGAIAVLFDDAQAAGFKGPLLLTRDFDDALDSAGVAYADEPVNRAVDILAASLEEVVLTLCEDRADVAVDAATMTLQLFGRQGQERLDTELARAVNVTDLSTTRSHEIVNDLYGRIADGTYVHVEDTASIAAHGRISRGVSLGASTVGAAAAEMASVLSTLTEVTDTLDLKHALYGAVPYGDPDNPTVAYYERGDTVTAPAHREGTGPARVLAITVEQAEGADYASAYPDLLPDPTAEV